MSRVERGARGRPGGPPWSWSSAPEWLWSYPSTPCCVSSWWWAIVGSWCGDDRCSWSSPTWSSAPSPWWWHSAWTPRSSTAAWAPRRETEPPGWPLVATPPGRAGRRRHRRQPPRPRERRRCRAAAGGGDLGPGSMGRAPQGRVPQDRKPQIHRFVSPSGPPSPPSVTRLLSPVPKDGPGMAGTERSGCRRAVRPAAEPASDGPLPLAPLPPQSRRANGPGRRNAEPAAGQHEARRWSPATPPGCDRGSSRRRPPTLPGWTPPPSPGRSRTARAARRCRPRRDRRSACRG